LSSKDTDPTQIAAVYRNLGEDSPIDSFTIGIDDDVTHLSLAPEPLPDFQDTAYSCKFWGLGGDGTVGANHNTIKILGDAKGMYSQAYFEYDAKKSFGITKSHLRLSEQPIRSSYYVKKADFLACHQQSYLSQYDIVDEVKEGGKLLVNTSWNEEELETHLSNHVKSTLAKNNIRLYVIDATKIARETGLGSHTNTVLQAAFFKASELMDVDAALDLMKDAARKTYFAKGSAVVDKNVAAIEQGAEGVREVAVPASWADLPEDPKTSDEDLPYAVKNLLFPINRQHGDDLPVSTFEGYEDGVIDLGLTAYEKRGIAVQVPEWNAAKCIQCNRCAYVCPHAAIRPFLVSEDEAQNAPDGFETAPLKGAKNVPGAEGLTFRMQVDGYDCTGCGSCANVCPVKDGEALYMVPADLSEDDKTQWNYALSLSDKGDLFDPYTVKGSQFRTPLVEFSAACAGCGETPYAKLLTQLFGDRIYWANATGCSQAWGSPMPGIPYTKNKRGFGPAWTNSLFENNAELALGMYLSVNQQREKQKMRVEALDTTGNAELSAAVDEWLATYDSIEDSRAATDKLEAALEALPDSTEAAEILRYKDQLAKKTFWMFGGDGWAYDIGFGGLDHVVAQGVDINVLIVDTEVYSNTGGQSSKATPMGAVAQFASAGKKTSKKDLGAMLMSYGNVYVASVAMGADMNQLLKAIKEAESFPGPSIVIAYSPCTVHGIRAGVNKVQDEMKKAVDAGYWFLYRYDPRNEQPMTLDSKAPSLDYEEFLDGETRYASLRRTFPENADTLFAEGKETSAARYEKYKKMLDE